MERKFKVSVSWEIEVTAVDEEDAYFKALDELDRQILDAVRSYDYFFLLKASPFRVGMQ